MIYPATKEILIPYDRIIYMELMYVGIGYQTLDEDPLRVWLLSNHDPFTLGFLRTRTGPNIKDRKGNHSHSCGTIYVQAGDHSFF